MSRSVTHNMNEDAPMFPEGVLPLRPDLRNTLHGLHRSLHELAVVAYRNVPALLELDGRVLTQINILPTCKKQVYSPPSSPCPLPSGRPSSSELYGGCASSYMCGSDMPTKHKVHKEHT